MSNLHKNDANRKKILHKLNNDNIDAANKEAKRLAKVRVARNRRLAAFFIMAIIIIGFLSKTIMNQNERLEAKQHILNEREEELVEALETQELLKLQIAKLDDDEYIAKLARKEYFLSEKGEIIFTIPDESKDKSSDKDKDKDEEE
jgi:cell division protein DivIC